MISQPGLLTEDFRCLQAAEGTLTMIVGAVGSGKTSLIDGVLNELDVTAGTTKVHGRVALCQQQPWIQAGHGR